MLVVRPLLHTVQQIAAAHMCGITHMMRTVHVRCEARAVDAARASRDACSCLRSTGVSGYLYEYEFRISFRSRAARAW